LLCVGDVKKLRIVDVTKIGAFVDIGLERDVLLPYKEQTRNVEIGESILCAMYVDKTNRLALTMNVYKFLEKKSPYKIGDTVVGTCYEKSDNYGMFVAVDDKYSALISKKELVNDLNIGDEIAVRVFGIRSDGRMNLSLRKGMSEQVVDDEKIILDILNKNNNKLIVGEDASPNEIKRAYGMSKKQFKRVISKLINDGKIDKESVFK